MVALTRQQLSILAITVLSGIGAATACAQDTSAESRDEDERVLRGIAAAVSPRNIIATTAEICRIGSRRAASEGCAQAAALVAARLSSLGLRPNLVAVGEAIATEEVESVDVAVRLGAAREAPLARVGVRPGSTALARTELPLVSDAGAASPPDGSWALLGSSARARTRPGCVLVLEPARDPGLPHDAVVLDPLPCDVPRVPVITVTADDAARLQSALAIDPPPRVIAEVRTKKRLAAVEDVVVAMNDAVGRPEIRLIACLATQSGGPGADESAAGVAALLEVARLLVAAKEPWPIALTLEFRGSWSPRTQNEPPAAGKRFRLAFGRLGLGAQRECLYAIGATGPTESPTGAVAAKLLSRFRGRRGFWPEFETLAVEPQSNWFDDSPRGTGLLLCSGFGRCRRGADSNPSDTRKTPTESAPGAPVLDCCPVSGTSLDTAERTVMVEPSNATMAARLAAMLIVAVAEAERRR